MIRAFKTFAFALSAAAVTAFLLFDVCRLYGSSQDTENSRYLMFAFDAGNTAELASIYETSAIGSRRRDPSVCSAAGERIALLPNVLPSQDDGEIARELLQSATAMDRACALARIRVSYGSEEAAAIRRQQACLGAAVTREFENVRERFPQSTPRFASILYTGHPMLKELINRDVDCPVE